MRFKPVRKSAAIAGLAAFALTSLHALNAVADDHPQEVLDLIVAHDALAMKIRPLQDRLAATAPSDGATGFRPEGAPVRAKASIGSEKNTAEAEKRMPATLTHRDRAVSADDDYGRIKVRLSTLAANAKAERERVMRPSFGAGVRRAEEDSGSIRFGDGQHGTRPSAGTSAQPQARAGSSPGADAKQIAEARRKLAELQREYAGVEREVAAREARAYERPKSGTRK